MDTVDCILRVAAGKAFYLLLALISINITCEFIYLYIIIKYW